MYWKFNKVTPSQSFEKFYTTIFHHLVIDPLLKSHHPTLHDPTQSYPTLFATSYISTIYPFVENECQRVVNILDRILNKL